MYATKRRRRNVKNYKHPPKENQKSNPSKRHRERLNAELENLSSILPFEPNVLTKLDKLSILRLAVSYLRIKAYFQVSLKNSPLYQYAIQHPEHERNRLAPIQYLDPSFSEGNSILESLNGFILIVNTNSEVFYASRTVEQYIGFHQSDIIHQSVFELIHSEDREEFKKHLSWNSKLPPEKANLKLSEILSNKEYHKYLERNFTVRFRCLLDNTSGFLTLDIVGRLSTLDGQASAYQLNPNSDSSVASSTSSGKSYKTKNMKASMSQINADNALNANKNEPTLALFAIACPFGPPSLFELPNRDSLFKTKHKINLTPISIDSKGKLILGYNEADFVQTGAYDLVHSDDLKYYASAHKELLKSGSSGLICYRLMTSDKSWQWIQSSMRIIYKSNKPEFIIANHRPLTNQEGEELFYKRGFEFKLPYPCLYDFESNFSSSVHTNSQSSNENSKSVLNSTPENKQQPHHQQQQHQQVTKSKPQSTQSTNRANSSTSTTAKTKTPKQSKSQLMRVQQQVHQSVVQPVYNQEAFQQTHAYLSAQHSNGHSYKFNSAYPVQTGSHQHHNIEHYYKTELNEDYKSHLLNSHDYSLVSASSIGSTSSSSSSSASSSDNISVNISASSTYPYTSTYFSHNSYPYSNENSKFYSASPYSFYSSTNHNHYNYNQSFGASEAAAIQAQNGTVLNSNLHSNNSSCSSTSSNNSSSIENQHSYNSGAVWPESIGTESSATAISLKFSMPLSENPAHNQHHQQHHQTSHHSNNHQQLTHSAYNNISDLNVQLNTQSYNELLANNAAALAAAKYSCAAAASTYSSYPFSSEDYNASVSQIQL